MQSSNPNVTDWMSAWGQIVGAVGGLAGFVALVIEVWRRRRSEARPPGGLLQLLVERMEAFEDIIAMGGQESLGFLSPELRHQDSMLAVLNGQVVDDELNMLVAAARAEWMNAFSYAPGTGALRVAGNADRVTKQLEAATRGQQAAAKAIDRANKLIRTTPGAR